ncbi:LAGLIDADG family homing endonuclease [Nanoarchaeota archaeon]
MKKQIVLKKKILLGYSINEISREEGLSRATIYYHSKKFSGGKCLLPVFKISATDIEGEVGIFAGDGSQYFYPKDYHYEIKIHFGNKNLEYAQYVKNLFSECFNKRFRLQQCKGGTVVRIRNKVIFNYFHLYLDYISSKKHCTVKLKTLKLPNKFLIGFLKGFFDTDGCLRYDSIGRRKRAFYTTTSKTLADQIIMLLGQQGVLAYLYVCRHPTNKTRYQIQLSDRSIDNFLKVIRPFKIRNLMGR